MKKKIAIVLVIALAISMLAACGKKSNGAGKESSKNAKAAKLYSKVLDDIKEYDFGDKEFFEEKYQYSIVQMEKDKTPQLIVEQAGKEGTVSAVRVFSVNDAGSEIVALNEALPVGVAGAGGFRGGVSARKDGDGLSYSYFNSGSGDSTIEKVTILKEGKEFILKHENQWEGRVDQAPTDNGNLNINFVDVKNREQLKALSKIKDGKFSNKEFFEKFKTEDEENNSNENSEKVEKNEADENDLDAKIKAEQAAGNYVISGTLKHLSHSEVLSVQGIQEPNPGSDRGESYDILILDDKLTLSLLSSGGMGQYRDGEVKMIAFRDQNLAEYYDKHITISFSKDKAMFPSDTRLPLGEPTCFEFKIIS